MDERPALDEELLQQALSELVAVAPDAINMSRRALPWAVRLARADDGLILDHSGRVLAEVGFGDSLAAEFARTVKAPDGSSESSVAGRAVLILPLPSESDGWSLRLVGGHEMPTFPSATVERLTGYAAFLAIAMQSAATRYELAREREKYQAIFDTALLAVITMDETGVITGWNLQAEATFGWPASEAVGRQLADTIVPPKHRDAQRIGLAHYLATSEGPVLGKTIEITALHREGHELPVELWISVATRAEQHVSFFAFVRDITERKRIEDRQAAPHEISAILASGGAWTKVASQVMASLCQHLGWDLAEYWGFEQGAGALRREQSWQRRPNDFAALNASSAASSFERGAGLPGLVWEQGEVVSFPSFDMAGLPRSGPALESGIRGALAFPVTAGREFIGVMALYSRAVRTPTHDIAAGMADIGRQLGQYVSRTRADASVLHLTKELELQAQRNYRVLFEGSPVPMLFCDFDNETILEANAAAVSTYGYTRDELLGLSVRELWVPRQDDDQAALTAAARSGVDAIRLGPLLHERKDGTVIEVLVTSYAVTYGGRPARFVIVEDVTERQKLERQLLQSQRLESLGQLAGGVAHDFNNLLGVIMNFAQFAKDKIVAARVTGSIDQTQQAIRDLDRITKAADSAAKLTHQLLAFARREALKPEPIDVNSVVGDLEPLLRRTVGEHITFVTSLESNLWTALMDAGQLEQALTNLVVNSRDAMPDGGKLLVETDNVEVDAAYATGRPGLKPGQYVRIRVTDTGIGMEPATLRRAFEPFFTTKPPGKGTGFGLATVHGIVNQVGGHVSIYSEVRKGTRVHVLLPATQHKAARPSSSAPAIRTISGVTVLLVEDAEDMREVTERILTRNGYEVITAANGLEAIGRLGNDGLRIDLLLTDVVMPQMNGVELAKRVTAALPGTRVLFMSGYAEPLLGSSATIDPSVTLLEKPFTESGLLAKVQQVLETAPSE